VQQGWGLYQFQHTPRTPSNAPLTFRVTLVGFLVITVTFFVVASVFLFVLFFVWLLSKEDIG
jgi:hypothetical protein